MKGQARIDFRTRKNAKSSTAIVRNKVKIVDDEVNIKAFRPVEEIPFEPVKVQKPEIRKSGRIASKSLKQTVLVLKDNDDKEELNAEIPKRKSDNSLEKHTTKKQKPLDNTKEKADITTKEKAFIEDESKPQEKEIVTVKETVIEELVVNKTEIEQSDKEEVTKETVSIAKETDIKETESKDSHVNTITEVEEEVEEEEEELQPTDSPSPPSFLTEPSTPPVHLEIPAAPYKTYLTEADKMRIEQEKSTLIKLRKALDIVITDRMARHRPTLYHQIESVLRNSTRKTITMAHISQMMYLAPNLYQLDAKELRDFGGKVSEAFLIQFSKEWKCPLAGKDLQKRADIIANTLDDYFTTHKEPDATIPEAKLPRLNLVVDKKEWMKEAKLPPGVKALIDAHEKVKEAEIEEQKPKPKPTGTVKDRMAALRARLAAKKAT